MRRVFKWVLVGVMAFGWSPGSAAAQEAEERFGLQWEAPAGCPGRAFVEEEIAFLIQSSELSEWPSVRASAVIVPDGPRWTLTMEIQVGEAQANRELTTTSCGALGGAAALIVALLIDPAAVASAPVREAPEPPAPAPGSGSGAGVSFSPARTVGPTQVVDPSRGTETTDPEADATASAGDAPAAVDDERPPPVQLDRPEEPADPAPTPGIWGILAGTLFGSGTLPGLAAGAEMGVRWGRGPLQLGFAVQALPSAAQELTDGGGFGARFGYYGGVARLGADWLKGPGIFGPHLEVEAGAILARGVGVSNPTQSAQGWFAVGVHLEAGYVFSERYRLVAGGSAMVPTQRYRFSFDDLGEVHEVQPIVLRLKLGFGIDFR